MAHYAYLDNNNIVVAVTVGKDETELINGLDTETYYAQGTDYTVKRTSYNGNIRGTYAGIGYYYNEEENIFVAPQPYLSWTRNGSFWEAPTPYPTDGLRYRWVEDDLNWQVVEHTTN
jgi:hypothetical protein